MRYDSIVSPNPEITSRQNAPFGAWPDACSLDQHRLRAIRENPSAQRSARAELLKDWLQPE
jgi:hypothetical protein